MGEGQGGMRRGLFGAWVGTIVGVAVIQSAVHLLVVLGDHRIGTLVDVDRSNGVPDLVSTVALAAGVAGAFVIAREERAGRRVVSVSLVAVLTALTLADLLHDGPHPASGTGWLVIVVVTCAGVLLAMVAADSSWRARTTLVAAAFLLVCSFLVNGLDQYDQWFERKRGDPVAEYQTVAKEGLELLGWSLVALALWDEALCRPRRSPSSRPV